MSQYRSLFPLIFYLQLIIFVDDLPIILKGIASEGYVFEMKVLLISCVLAFVFGNVQGMLYILFKLHTDLCSFPHFIYGYTLFYSQLTPLSLSLSTPLSLWLLCYELIFSIVSLLSLKEQITITFTPHLQRAVETDVRPRTRSS